MKPNKDKKTCCLLLALALSGPFFSGTLYANKGGVGISFAKDQYLDNDTLGYSLGQLTINVYAAYYLNPSIALSIAFESDIEHSNSDPIDIGLSAGGAYFFNPIDEFSPFIKSEVLVLLDPEQSFGFRIAPGIRWEMFRLFATNGCYLFYQLGFKALYDKTNAPFYSVELFRLGFEYYF